MIQKKISYILLILGLFVSVVTKGQQSYLFTRNWSASFFVGTSNFHGDVADYSKGFVNNTPFSKYFYMDRRFGLGVNIDKMFNPYLGVKGMFMYSAIKGSSDKYKLYFNGDLYEYSFALKFDISNTFFGVDKYRKYDAYAFVGIGFSELRSELYDINGNQIGRIGYLITKPGRGPQRTTEIVVPIGLGGTYHQSKDLSFFFEITRHIINSSKVDAYPLEGGAKYESVGMINIGLTYHFRLPNHWSIGGNPRYNGRSNDPSIRKFNKKKHVVMKTKSNKRARKMRRKYGRKRFKRHRW